MQNSDERKNVINDIKNAINKRKDFLLSQLPLIHTINDGIIIRFFYGWSESEHKNVKYIEIKNNSEDKTKTYYFYLPKGSVFDVREHAYIEDIICLEGKIQLHYDDKTKILYSFSKESIPPKTKHYGIAIENTYLVVTSKF